MSKEAYLNPKKQFERTVKLDVEPRVREGVKTVLKEFLQREVTEHLETS